MSSIRNIFACLVHENPECIIDLVRNLRALDPDSLVLLYNGSEDAGLLPSSFPFERYNVVAHPSPRPAQWGSFTSLRARLHGMGIKPPSV